VAVGGAVIVAAPRTLRAALEESAEPSALVEPATLRSLVPSAAVLIGPAWVGYAPNIASEPGGDLRELEPGAPELAALRSAVSAEDWEHANLDAARPPIFASVASGVAVAAAGAELLLECVSHIGVVTHPAWRSRGLGRAVVRAAAACAHAQGRLAQYQTLASNAAALAIARSLGFEHFATTLAARWNGRPTA